LPILLPPSPTPITPRVASRNFLSFCPLEWGVDRVEDNGDEPGSILVRVYVVRCSTLASIGFEMLSGTSRPLGASYLPFSGDESWLEDSVLQHVQDSVSLLLQRWSGDSNVATSLSQQVLSSIEALDWIDASYCFCMPIVLYMLDSLSLP